MKIKITFYIDKNSFKKHGPRGIKVRLSDDMIKILISEILRRRQIVCTSQDIEYIDSGEDMKIICIIKIPGKFISVDFLSLEIDKVLKNSAGVDDIVKHTVEEVDDENNPIVREPEIDIDELRRGSIKGDPIYINESKIVNLTGVDIKIGYRILHHENLKDVIHVELNSDGTIRSVTTKLGGFEPTVKYIVGEKIFKFFKNKNIPNIFTPYNMSINSNNYGLIEPPIVISYVEGTGRLHDISPAPSYNDKIEDVKTNLDLPNKEYEVKTSISFGFRGKPENAEEIFKEYLETTCGIFREYVKDRKFTNTFNEAKSFDDHLEVVQKVTIYESDIENFEFINTTTSYMRELEKKHKCSITTNIIITEGGEE